MAPAVSVIIPTFNRSQALVRCLDRLEMSEFQDFEVIVVDDGSTPPVEFARSYRFSTRLVRQLNSGPGAARNAGAGHAAADIYFFLDDDCFVAADAIANCVQAFEDKSLSVLGADILNPDGAGWLARVKNARSRLRVSGEGAQRLCVSIPAGCAYAIRRDVFARFGGFDPAYQVHEDDHLWGRMRRAGLTLYRSAAVQVEHDNSFKTLADVFDKAFLWSGEDDDRFILDEADANPEGDRQSLYLKRQLCYLKNPTTAHLLIFSLIGITRWAHTVGQDLLGVFSHRGVPGVHKLIFNLVWEAGILWGLLSRYGRVQGIRLSRRFGVFAEWIGSSARFLFRKGPYQLVLFVTNRCQADCDHCFYFEKLNSSHNDLTLEEYGFLSRDLGPLKKIYISGGEPFLRADLPEIIQIFYRRNGLRTVSIPTNGYLTARIGEKVTAILRRCLWLECRINVSLDGFPETHDRIRKVPGGYAHALNTLNLLCEMKKHNPRLKVGINVTRMSQNWHEFPAFIEHLKKDGPSVDTLNTDVAFSRLEGGLSRNRDHLAGIPFSEEKALEAVSDVKRPVFSRNPAKYLKWFFRETVDEAYRELVNEERRTRKQPTPCRAPDIFSVIRENGDTAYCEQRPAFGNLRSKTLKDIYASSEARTEANAVAGGACSCSQCFFQEANLLVYPWIPSNLRLYGRGIKKLMRRIRRKRHEPV